MEDINGILSIEKYKSDKEKALPILEKMAILYEGVYKNMICARYGMKLKQKQRTRKDKIRGIENMIKEEFGSYERFFSVISEISNDDLLDWFG